MTTLDEVQEFFQAYLLEKKLELQNLVLGTDKVSVETRMEIYGHAYKLRLIDSLASNFPILYLFLGTDNFDALAELYINSHPSCYRSIRWYGDQLPAFLQHHHDYHDFPYLTELAQFEWSMTLAFDAADAPILQIEDIARIPPEDWMAIRLHAHPSVQRLNLSWNVTAIWQALTDDHDAPDAIKSDTSSPWILWRYDFMNRFCMLTADEAWAIDSVLKGLTFGEICEGLCQWFKEDEAGIHAASLLKGWIQSGLLTNVTFIGDQPHDQEK